MSGWLNFTIGTAVMFVVFLGTAFATTRLRAARLIICRDEARLDVAAWLVGSVAYSFLATRGNGWPGFVIAFVTLNVAGPGVGYLGRYGWAWRLKVHWSHDEDCEFGPRRKRGGAPAKLRTWRKVALRPGLAAS